MFQMTDVMHLRVFRFLNPVFVTVLTVVIRQYCHTVAENYRTGVVRLVVEKKGRVCLVRVP